MPTKRELKKKLTTVFWITISWTIISMVQLAYEAAFLKEYQLDYRWATTGNFMDYFLINTLAFVFNGFIGGILIVFVLRKWIRGRSYTFGILYGILVYIILFFTLTCLQNYFVVHSIWNGKGSFFNAYVKGLEDYFFSYEFARNFPFWLLVLTATLIILFVNDKYGPGEFKKFLLGKYFHPKSEERIFMFLDLKGSTSIAEKLGEHQYFKFLRNVYRDITPVLLDTKAEVYQYVGDEVVISWSLTNGTKDSNCVNCFYNIKGLLKRLEPVYTIQFGVVPEFKAGLHCGMVIIGEIGVIKRDIAYSGDVLNTTARIQGKCNELGTSMLISKILLNHLPKAVTAFRSMGLVKLRGKSEPLELYGI